MRRFVLLFLVFIFIALPVRAESPYLGYTFDFWVGAVPAPVAYTATRSISAADISPDIGAFSWPQDFSVDRSDIIYLLDTGNNRIVVFDYDLNYIKTIYGFYNNGVFDTFNSPGGVFVCYHYNIYIADTENRRVVILDNDGNLISIIENPDLGIIEDEVDFRPQRVAADIAGRVYVIVMHVFEGIMRFDEYGNFFGYFGTIGVRASAIDLFWRTIATQEQRARQRRFIPTEFTGLDVDEYGFVFATHLGTGPGNRVMRLNPRGNNVIRNFNPSVTISGDQRTFRVANSSFVDVTARDNGMFSVLDSTRNRVFTYDSEGNLLYVFGGEGEVMGMMRTPVAIGAVNDSVLVLDSARGRLVYFEPTEYGALINQAVGMLYTGDEAYSLDIWRQILHLNEFNSLALIGIGRAHLVDGNYALAMDYLRGSMDLRYFSRALIRRRQEFVETYLPPFLTGVMVLVGLLIVRSLYRNVKGLNRREEEAYE